MRALCKNYTMNNTATYDFNGITSIMYIAWLLLYSVQFESMHNPEIGTHFCDSEITYNNLEFAHIPKLHET